MNCQICGAELPSDALFCGECGSSTSATPQTRQRSDARSTDTTLIKSIRPRQSTGIVSVSVETGPASVPADFDIEIDLGGVDDAGGDIEAEASTPGAQLELRFSTGESFQVSGNGLIGRRPAAGPEENFEHLVQITDPGRSVSKSHLEFGQHEGEFWVSDRTSGNGTVLHRADGTVISCEPGRRYLVGAGTRVELGEQSFVVV